MRLKYISLLVILVILLGAPLTLFETNTVYGSGTIYILANGDINPSTATISSTDQQTYVFTDNINDPIVVQRSNIVIDGAGYSLTASASEQAIYIYSLTNVTITNIAIQQSKTGILLKNCSSCSITQNPITNNIGHAIELVTSSNNNITGNRIIGNSNRAMILNGSSDNTIDDNFITNNYRGIELTSNAMRNTISHNYISNSNEGIYVELYSSQNIILENNIIRNQDTGITITTWSSNNTIDGNTLGNNTDTGLLITQSPNCTVIYNEAIDNYYGIRLMYVNTTLLRNNQMFNNHYDFAIYFNGYSDFLNDVDATNTVSLKPIYYWVDKQDLTVPADAGIVILHNCTDILVENLNITYAVWQAIVIGYSLNVTITSNNIESTGYRSENCIQLWNTTGCMIDHNYLDGAISIKLDYSQNNTIYHNTLTGGSDQGAIRFQMSENNVFYHNYFINNTIDVLSDQASSNYWDNGYPDGGNYWDSYVERMGSYARDDYSGPGQNQPGADGFWDTAYPINDNNTDRYPIVPEYSTIILFVSLISTTTVTVIAFRRKKRAVVLRHTQG